MNGAMTVRMIELGARAGFSAEQTVLFVMDGVPLPYQQPAGIKLPAETQPRPPLKRDVIADLWDTTALRQPVIAEMAQTTPGTVSFFLREMRRAGDERVIRGDAARGLKFPGHAPDEAPMEVDGVDVGAATAVPSQLDDIPPAGEHEGGGRTALAPDVSPDGASECAERDAGSSGEIAAGPVPPADTPVEDVSPQPASEAPAADTADRPAGPGQESSEASPLVSDEADRTHPGLSDAEADASTRSGAPVSAPRRSEQVLDLFHTTELTQRAIAARVGIGEHKISVMLKEARSSGDPRVIHGDRVRAKLDSERRSREAAERQARIAKPAPLPPVPAPEPAVEADALIRIEDGYICGPAGRVKSFPLISRVLAMLASGSVVNAREIAKQCDVRSGAAVRNQLDFWRGDLAKVGVTLIADADTLDLQLKLI